MDGTRRLSSGWFGDTRFDIIKQNVPHSYDYYQERMTRRQTTPRPAHSWAEFWDDMSKKQREQAIAEYGKNDRKGLAPRAQLEDR